MLFSSEYQCENDSELFSEAQSGFEENSTEGEVEGSCVLNFPKSATPEIHSELSRIKREQNVTACQVKHYNEVPFVQETVMSSSSQCNSATNQLKPSSHVGLSVSSPIKTSSATHDSLKQQIAQIRCDRKLKETLLNKNTISNILNHIQKKNIVNDENHARANTTNNKNSDYENASQVLCEENKHGYDDRFQRSDISKGKLKLAGESVVLGNEANDKGVSKGKLRKRKASAKWKDEHIDPIAKQIRRDIDHSEKHMNIDDKVSESSQVVQPPSVIGAHPVECSETSETLLTNYEEADKKHNDKLQTVSRISSPIPRKKRVSNGQSLLHCRRCRATFTSKVEKDNHMRLENWVGCPEDDCNFTSCSQHGILKHLVGNHKFPVTSLKERFPEMIRQLQCKVVGCNFIAEDNKAMRTHEITHATEKKYFCDICEKEFKHKHTFEAHTVAFHGDQKEKESLTCKDCKKSFATKHSLVAHEKRIHRGDKPGKFYCEICGFDAENNRKLLTHIWTVHDIPPPKKYQRFQCEICGYKTLQKGGYEVHLRRHKGERSHVCDLCGRSYVTEHELRAHQEYHKKSVDRKYKCDACAFSAVTSYKLERHKSAVHNTTGEKQHVCEVCDYRTNIRGNLTLHLRNTHKLHVETRKPLQSNEKLLKTARGAVSGEVLRNTKSKHELKNKANSAVREGRKTLLNSKMDLTKTGSKVFDSLLSDQPPPNVSLVASLEDGTVSVVHTSKEYASMTSQTTYRQETKSSASVESRNILISQNLTAPEIRILSNTNKTDISENGSETAILSQEQGFDANVLVYGLDTLLHCDPNSL